MKMGIYTMDDNVKGVPMRISQWKKDGGIALERSWAHAMTQTNQACMNLWIDMDGLHMLLCASTIKLEHWKFEQSETFKGQGKEARGEVARRLGAKDTQWFGER